MRFETSFGTISKIGIKSTKMANSTDFEATKNCISKVFFMVEYLSKLDENLMVRQTNICCFTPDLNCSGRKSSFDCLWRNSKPGKFQFFQEISENSEIHVQKTLFSEGYISSNICRIEMKSTPLERLDLI